VTDRYLTRIEANSLAKIADGDSFWHRMGDVGYLDEHDRFWYCGRLSERVVTAAGTMFTVPCEAILDRHPEVRRSALVGVGLRGTQRPVIIAELHHRAARKQVQSQIVNELRTMAASSPLTSEIHDFLLHPSLPVDLRHNVKIAREKLALWAAGRIR
jgi:acyl-CoA synthetase (AMP-forming)/AMP-acid ligase II